MAATTDFLDLTGDIVAAYVTRNTISAADLPRLIETVQASLLALAGAQPAPTVELTPPLPIKKTITPDHLISLEDGKPYRSLKRHLTALGMTPDQYRRKWGLPPDYPMVSAGYSALRSSLAKGTGLGKGGTRDNRGRVAKGD